MITEDEDGTIVKDSEIEALAICAQAYEPLSLEERRRVSDYLSRRYIYPLEALERAQKAADR